jgi:hypothetical protein
VATAAKTTAELNARLAAASHGPPPVDVDAEKARFAAMDTPDLLNEIHHLLAGRTNRPEDRPAFESAVRACDVALSRDLRAVERCEALTNKGVSLRELADLKPAEAVLREAMTLVTPASDEGRGAAIHLGWVLYRRRDPRAAAEIFLGVTRQPEAPAGQRAWLRHMAASFLAEAGDASRARDEYRGVVDEFAASDDAMAKQYVEFSRKALEVLDKSGH